MRQSARSLFELVRVWHVRAYGFAVMSWSLELRRPSIGTGLRAQLKAPPKHVLILFENGRLLPANVQADKGFYDAISAANTGAVVSAEFLDAPRFQEDAYTQNVLTLFMKNIPLGP